MPVDAAQGTLIRRDQNGSREVFPSGSTLLLESGATLTLGSTDVTATGAEINNLSGATATAAEINAAADLSVNGGLVRVKKISISTTPTGSEQDTGWDLPTKSVVFAVFVDVTTAEATGTTKTIDIGTLSSESGGDADGFVDGVSVATTGVKTVSLVAGAVTRGVLLKETVTGSGSATHSSPVPYSASANTAKSVSYTAGSNNFAEFRGAIYVVYMEIG